MFLKEKQSLSNDFVELSHNIKKDSQSFLSQMINQKNNPICFDEQMVLKNKEENDRDEELNAAQLLLNLASNSSLKSSSNEEKREEGVRKILKPHPKFRAKVNIRLGTKINLNNREFILYFFNC